jgi:hypothetical protein
MNEFAKKIEEVYKKINYFDKYGGSIVGTILILLIFFLLLSYFSIMSKKNIIKKNWNVEKCNPMVMPFAGFINKPYNMSSMDYTSKNFTGCINNILELIANEFIKPFTNLGSVMSSSINKLVNSVNSIRKKLNDVAKNFASIDNIIMSRIMNVLLPLRYMLIKIKDTIGRVQGTLVTSLYTILASYLGIKSYIANFVNFLVLALVVLAGIITALILSFFGIPAAIPLLTIFTAVAVPTSIFISKLSNILDITQRSVPSKPSLSSCFDENTPIRMINGTYKPIKDIYPNEILYGNTLVTAKMKLSTQGITMYKYKDTIVSGKHSVYINGKLTKIETLEEAEKIEEYNKSYIYCLNTDSKVLNINDEVYCDWDEITEGNLYILYKRLGSHFTPIFNRKDIHKYLDGGFIKGTMITMKDGSKKPIQDIQVDDILYGGTRVYGLVDITTNNLNVYNTELQGVNVIGAPNLQIYNESLGHFSHLQPLSILLDTQNKPTKLYHLLTESKRIVVNGCSFYDYNGCLDVITDIHPSTPEYKKYINSKNDEYINSPQFNQYNNYQCRKKNKEPSLLKKLFSRKERRREKYVKMLYNK